MSLIKLARRSFDNRCSVGVWAINIFYSNHEILVTFKTLENIYFKPSQVLLLQNSIF